MPTNKLWLEHTERAAWESVSALRHELAEEKKRLERLAPPVEGWPALFAGLDALREEHSLGGKTYADVIRGIVGRLSFAESRLKSAQLELAQATRSAAPLTRTSANGEPDRPLTRTSESPGPTAEEARAFEIVAKRFVRSMQRRHQRLLNEEGPLGTDELLAALGAKIDELGELGELGDAEIADSAVEIAVLALWLHRQTRHE